MVKPSQRSKKDIFCAVSSDLFRKLQEAVEKEPRLEEFLEKTAAIIGQTLGHNRVTIFLYDSSAEELCFIRGWKDEPVDFPVGYRQKISLGLMGKAIREKRPLVVNDVTRDKDYLEVPGARVGSEACFPILLKNGVLGLLDVHDRRKKAFSREEVDFLSFLTRFLGAALAEKQKTEELLVEQQQLREILNGMRDGYYEVDREGNFVFVNDSLSRAWGRQKQDIIGRNYREFLELESIARVFSVFNEVFRTGRPRGGIEIQIRDVSGEIHHVELSISLKKNSAGVPVGFYGIVHDVTERVKIEERLRYAYARLSGLLEAFPDAVYFKEASGKYLIVNQAMEKLTGRKKEEIVGKTSAEVFPEDLARQCRASDEQIIKTQKPAVFYESMTLDDGRVCYFESHKVPVFDAEGQFIGIAGISRDVTEKKIAEEKLKQSERDFRSLFENSTLGLYRTTPDGRILLANPTIIKMLGYKSFEELASRNLEENGFEPSYQRQMFLEKVEQEGEVRGLEAAWKRKDGSILWVRESARAVRDENGRVLYYEGTVEDITEKKLAEIALAQQKELFQTVIDSAEDIVFVINRNYELLLFNQAAARKFGLSSEELKSKSFRELYPREGWEEARERFDRVFGGEVVRADVEFGDKKIILNVTEVPLRNEQGEIYALCGIARDLTTRVELEKALELSLKEKEVLLREIHHRVKNNMQVISSMLNVQAHFVNRPEFTAIIKECQNRIRSMALIHEHLYKFGQLSQINFGEYLNRLLVHLYNVHRVDRKQVELELDCQPVEIDIGLAIPLGLISNEIISNCFKHAFPAGKQGKVRVALEPLGPNGLKLEISDTGVGFPEGVNLEQSTTFGLQLVGLLKDQIGAELIIDRSSGTRFTIVIPAKHLNA
ncbi:MAG: PAS domain S-box protein [Candidatus Aminicenantes bacterium]|nr:PAS domain S-box protein [Candidatus Aminicenantes bacterium]